MVNENFKYFKRLRNTKTLTLEDTMVDPSILDQILDALSLINT